MPAGGLVAGGVVAIGSSILGGIAAGKERDKAQAALDKARDIIAGVGAPPDLAKQIILEQFKVAGV
jgi:hypothetical protein